MKKIFTVLLFLGFTVVGFGQLSAPKGIIYKGTLLTPSAAQLNRVDPTSSIQGQLNGKVGIYPIYYVSPSGSDAANGLTIATAWQTINKINTSTFVAGSKILFEKGGTWREQLEIPSSGTADAYITFSSYGTNPLDAPPRIIGSTHAITWTNTTGNIWESATTLNEPYLTDTDPHGNIYFIGTSLAVTVGKRKTYSGGYGNLVAEYDWTWNANKIYVYSATDPDVRYNSIEAAQRLHAFHLEGEQYIEIDGIDMFYTQTTGVWEAYPTTNKTGLIVRNCEIAYIGYPAGDGFGTHASYNNVLYEHNIIHDCGRRGISLNNYSNNIIQNTTVQNNVFYNGNHTTSIDIATGMGGYNNVIIRSNLIYDPSSATRSSIQMYANAAGGTLTNLYIYNNIFKNPSPESLRFNGHIASAYVYNNTFYQQATYSYTGDAHFIEIDDAYSTGSNTISIKNNIFYSLLATDLGGAGVGIYSEPAQNYALLAVDYNRYYRTGTLRVISANSASYHMDDLATIRSGLGWETNSPAFADPAFTTDGYDFSLQSTSTCIDAGINVGISNDFYGYKRVRITDIGAIERQAIKQ